MVALLVVLWVSLSLNCAHVSAITACSVGCPTGHYESKPCTNFGDRVCTRKYIHLHFYYEVSETFLLSIGIENRDFPVL